MKLSLRSLVTVAPLMGICLSSARADYGSTFTTPPYAIDQSVIGVAGWDYRLPTTEDHSEKARVVAVRWNGYQPAMMMKGANLKNVIPPTTGGKVRVAFDLAVTFPDAGGTGKQFRLGFAGAPCGEIYMDLGAEGGLGYQADGSGRGGVVALKKGEVKVNSFYHYAVLIDFPKMTYDITITGVKRDESPFSYKAEGVAFESRSKAVTSIYILSGGSLTAYLASMEIKSE